MRHAHEPIPAEVYYRARVFLDGEPTGEVIDDFEPGGFWWRGLRARVARSPHSSR